MKRLLVSDLRVGDVAVTDAVHGAYGPAVTVSGGVQLVVLSDCAEDSRVHCSRRRGDKLCLLTRTKIVVWLYAENVIELLVRA